MFTIVAINREDKHTEYYEVGVNFSVWEAGNEKMNEYKEKFPEAVSFIVGTNMVMPVLKEFTYDVLNSKGTVVKTLY